VAAEKAIARTSAAAQHAHAKASKRSGKNVGCKRQPGSLP
jgi:hypothetical protein